MPALAVDLDASPSALSTLPPSLLPSSLPPSLSPSPSLSAALPAPLAPIVPAAPALEPTAVTVIAQAASPARAVEESLDRYVSAAMDLIQRTALQRVRGLREPHCPADPIAALRTVDRLAEALSGFLVGAALQPMAQRLRQAGGPEVRSAMQQALESMASADGPAALPVHVTVADPPRFLGDADARPLVDDLGRKLCARLMLARHDLRALLRQLITAAERAHTGSATMIASTLAVAIHAALGDLRWLAERVGAAVTEAWDHAAAVMRKQPRLGGAWAQWSRRAAGLPEPRAELSTADVVAAGFVMQIG